MNSITFDLTKTEHYHKLKPYGHFIIKWKTRQGHLPNIIPMDELRFDGKNSMPVSEDVDKIIVKFMKKNKTDILVDDRGTFYTRAGAGFTEVSHKKLSMYGYDEGFKLAVDEKYKR